MNRIAGILISLVFATSAFAKERPKAFGGVSFGASVQEARKALSERPGVKVSTGEDGGAEGEVPATQKIEATGGKFAEVDVLTWALEFTAGKFSRGTVTFKTTDDGKANYRNFRQKLMDKYGGVTRETKTNTTWVLPPDLWDKHARTIKLDLVPAGETGLQLSIVYVDDTLVAAGQPKAARPGSPTLIPQKPEPSGL